MARGIPGQFTSRDDPAKPDRFFLQELQRGFSKTGDQAVRVNLPIFDDETRLREDQYLISRTDIQGRIVYANPAFVEVSGFERDELIGQPHNIVRHPDMPSEAYEDLWDTLQRGQSWLGVVKNRRKDGGYYWVLANATPHRRRRRSRSLFFRTRAPFRRADRRRRGVLRAITPRAGTRLAHQGGTGGAARLAQRGRAHGFPLAPGRPCPDAARGVAVESVVWWPCCLDAAHALGQPR
ncbi:hypothetical protein BTL50_09830 [Bordetella holmesii]|nr:PAS domain-containing protein [Bordetella holmesii]AUL23066.1 hypothetical protein BTL48_09835 [Bordetella holmesii]AUL29724.1 hypothetical protein BTL50_09830 [Bordetella holmesii]AUL35812.1 hypothetical protein BTL52_06360 [Bordetella holmesii]QBS65144.1 hypothetical protein B2B12_08290 [Bordetella holmesii]